MKKLYSLLFAILLALPLFAVDYQAPITVWEGTCGELYGYDKCVIVPQSEYDWTKVVADCRLTIYYKEALTEQRFLFLYACASKEEYEANNYFEIGDTKNSYEINKGETYFQIVLDEDDVSAFESFPSLLVLVYDNKEPVFTKITIEYPANSATALQNASVENIYAYQGTVVAPEAARIYSLTGQDVTSQNGHLQNGIYVVRTANKTVKVVVK